MHSERLLYSRTMQKYQNNTYAHVPAPDCHLFFSIYLPSLFYSLPLFSIVPFHLFSVSNVTWFVSPALLRETDRATCAQFCMSLMW